MSCKYNNCKHCGYKSECEIFKENAELKSRECWKSCEYANPKSELIAQHIKDVQQLTKAKEIIKYLLSFIQKENYKTRWDINIAEAEQFLKDDGCPDVMCEDCTKEDCGIKKLGLVEVEK